MKYLVIKANVDSDGILKDLRQIYEKADELKNLACEMERKITLNEESTENADSSMS